MFAYFLLKSVIIYDTIGPNKYSGGHFMLYRKIESFIRDHLKSKNNKILLIEGARQIGKTYIIRKVSKELFENYIEVNFVSDATGARLFENVHSIDDFYFALSTVAGDKMKDRENTIVFLDEIQEYPQFITLLKFLREDNRGAFDFDLKEQRIYRIPKKHTFLGFTIKALTIHKGN